MSQPAAPLDRPAWIDYARRFVGWSIAFAVLYLTLMDDYGRVIVAAGELLVNLQVPLSLVPHPRGILATSPAVSEPMGVPYSVSLIGLNVIFAPALVLATLGMTLDAAVRVLLAILIMIGLQAVEIWSILMFYLSHPDNTWMSLEFSESAVTAYAWIYRFLDRMCYVLFPFLAWAIVCPDVIGRLLSPGDERGFED